MVIYMARRILGYFDHSFIMALTLVFMGIGIMCQVIIGIFLQKMAHDTDIFMGSDSKILTQCKEKFVNCYKLNGGVGNISVFVDKFMNRLRFLGMSVGFIKHLSGQMMLAGVFMAGFGVCKGIVEGRAFVELVPFYIISLFGIYAYLSISSIVDIPSRRKTLKINLTDYLENHVAQRLEHGMLEKEKLLWELSQNDKKDKVKESKADAVNKNIAKKDINFSKEDAKELEGLLKSFINSES